MYLAISASANIAFGAEGGGDSLRAQLKVSRQDTTRVKLLNDLAWELCNINPDTAIALSTGALSIAQKEKWKPGIAKSEHRLGWFNYLKGDYEISQKHYQKALVVWEELYTSPDKAVSRNGKIGKAKTISNISNIYSDQANYPKALAYCFQALKIAEELHVKDLEANVLGNIGIIYDYQGNYIQALNYYSKALKIEQELGNKSGIARQLGNIGIVYEYQSDYLKAREYYFSAMKIAEELGDKSGIARQLGNIGNIYDYQGNYPKALDYYLRALKMKEELGDKSGIIIWLGNIGSLYLKAGMFKEAEVYLKKTLSLSEKINSLEDIKFSHQGLSKLYETTGRMDLALLHYKKFIVARDSINSEENQKKQVQLEMNYEFEKKEMAAKAEQDKKNAIAAEEKQKQKIILFSVIGSLLLVIVFSGFLYNRFKITERQKQVIERQKQDVDKAYEQLHEKNKEVMDSIHYASRIQRALLTSEKYISKQLNKLTSNK